MSFRCTAAIGIVLPILFITVQTELLTPTVREDGEREGVTESVVWVVWVVMSGVYGAHFRTFASNLITYIFRPCGGLEMLGTRGIVLALAQQFLMFCVLIGVFTRCTWQ